MHLIRGDLINTHPRSRLEVTSRDWSNNPRRFGYCRLQRAKKQKPNVSREALGQVIAEVIYQKSADGIVAQRLS